MNQLLIIGAGGHARPVVEIAQLNNWNIAGIIDTSYKGGDEEILGVTIKGGMELLQSFTPSETSVFLAVGDNHQRKEIMAELRQKGYGDFPALIHPKAIVSESAKIENGTLVCAGSIINPLVEIGEGCIINTGTIIDHESVINSFVHLAPGVKLAGRVKIGANSFIGIGASIIDKIQVGEDVTIGAGSVIIKNIPPRSKVVGVSKIVD